MESDLDVALKRTLRCLSDFWKAPDASLMSYFLDDCGITLVHGDEVSVRRSNRAAMESYCKFYEHSSSIQYAERDHRTLTTGDSAFHSFAWEATYLAYPHEKSLWWPSVPRIIDYFEPPPLQRQDEQGTSRFSLVWHQGLERWQICWIHTELLYSPRLQDAA